jgi:predicted phosphodiesterase
LIGIISDIHGNDVALTAVLEAMDVQGVERIVSLGDVAGYYVGLDESIDLLRSRNATHLLGNHDWYLISGLPCPRSDSANRCLEHQRRRVTKESLRWLEQSPSHLALDGISMVHGGWRDPLDEYLYEVSEEYFSPLRGQWFFSGHTHVQGLWQFPAKTYCNPGSVGQPRDGDPRAAFATWDDGHVELHRVEYDVDAVGYSMASAGFEPYFYENLRGGTRIGGAIDRVILTEAG